MNADAVIAPPYDVVDGRQVEALTERSPYNVARVESPTGPDRDRYRQAAAALQEWRSAGALMREDAPVYYVYEQVFSAVGASYARRCFFARLRLSPPDAGLVRPHESTMSGPREDRLRLLRATQTNVSPILAMFPDEGDVAQRLMAQVAAGAPAFEATDDRGDAHRLWVVDDDAEISLLTAAVAASTVTIADGHHRYTTALNYLDERGVPADAAAPERWMLAGLVPTGDPGLLVLPVHRMLSTGRTPDELRQGLEALYEIQAVHPGRDGAALWDLVRQGADQPGTFGLIGPGKGGGMLLRPRSSEALDAAMPADWSPASRSVDALVLNETILRPVLGIDDDAVTGGAVTFTEDAGVAWRHAEAGDDHVAFLVNPTRVEQIVAVADAGEVLPQKSTFFYPKLATGMVLNPLE